MATLNLTFSAAPLPADFNGTPQQFLDAIISRLSVETSGGLSLFVSGGAAPTSNDGPWLKSGITWYVWDVITGSYVPEVIEFQSLRYSVSAVAPDPTKYTFWIELNGAGTGITLKTYDPVTVAWRDVYADKFSTYATAAVTTAAIAAAQTAAINAAAAANQQYPFRARKNAAAQAYTAGAGDTVVVFDTEDFDVGSTFASNTFTAPLNGYFTFKASAYVSNASGAPTGIDRQLKLRVNGVVVTRKNVQVNDILGGSTIDISDTLNLAGGDTVDVVINVTSTGASGWSVLNDSTNTFFTGHRVLIA